MGGIASCVRVSVCQTADRVRLMEPFSLIDMPPEIMSANVSVRPRCLRWHAGRPPFTPHFPV